MDWQFSLFSTIYLVASITSSIAAYLTLRRRAIPGRNFLTLLLIAIAEWSLGAAFESASVGIPAKIFWSKVAYIGTTTAPVLYLIFVLEYLDLGKRLTRRDRFFIWLIPVTTMIMAATNEWHHLLWSTFTFNPAHPDILIYGHGSWFWIFVGYDYILLTGGLVILIWAFIRLPRLFRLQIGVLLAGSCVPMLGNIIYIAGLSPVAGLDLTPLTFTLTGLILALGIFRFQLLDLLPVARDELVENMKDGVLVLDDQNRIVDINPTAQKFIGVSGKSALGQQVEIVLSAYSTIVSQYIHTPQVQSEICLSENPPAYVELAISPIYNQRKTLNGRLITIRDITQSKLSQLAVERNAREMAALYETSLEINSQPDLSSLLNTLIQRSIKLVGVTMGALYLVRPDEKSLEQVISYNMGKDYTRTIMQFGEGLSGRVAEKNEPMVVEDYTHWEGSFPSYKEIGAKRILGVPLRSKGKLIGVINIADKLKVGMFTPEEIRLVSLFADQAAIAIENTRLLEETNRHVEQLGIINRISLAITSGLDMDHVLKTLHEQCQHVAPCDIFYVALYDESSSLIHIPFYYENGQYQSGSSRDIKEDPGTIGNVIQAHQTLYLRDTFDQKTLVQKTTTGLRMPSQSYVGIPLTLRDRVMGVMSVQSYKPNAYSEDEIHLLEIIAQQAAIAIENARLYSEEQRLAIIDELTNVYNYRGLMALGGREIDRARRFGRNLSALFFDIDGFRNFNNKYSHTTGNLVLKAVAEQCLSSMRSVDLVSRFGGDEFVVLLPEATLTTAGKAAERLQADIATRQVMTSFGNLSVTISMGIAQLTDNITNLSMLIDRANQAEHKAKERGEGCIAAFEEN